MNQYGRAVKRNGMLIYRISRDGRSIETEGITAFVKPTIHLYFADEIINGRWDFLISFIG